MWPPRPNLQLSSLWLTTPITIASTTIRQDSAGRYCLNDLHRAAGGAPKDGPSHWLELRQADDLIDEIKLTTGIPAVKTLEGRYGGTYACKEMVYAYAMWISAKFHLQVIRAYDQMVAAPAAPVVALPKNYAEALRLAARPRPSIEAERPPRLFPGPRTGFPGGNGHANRHCNGGGNRPVHWALSLKKSTACKGPMGALRGDPFS